MDDSGSPIFTGLILFFLFIIIEFILYAFAAALDEISECEIQQRKKSSKKTKWILKTSDNPQNLIHTIHFTEILFAVLTGSLLVYQVTGSSIGALHIAAAVVVVLLFVLMFCILGINLAKVVGSHYEMGTVFKLAGIVKLLVIICQPVTMIIKGCVYLIAKGFGINTNQQMDEVTEEEIISMVNEGHEKGVLEANEAEMINNIFEFGDTEAQDIMTHRKNIVAVDRELNLREALEFMLNASNSRFPVYKENTDNIIGILHLKDAMKCLTSEQYNELMIKDIPGLIRPAVFIPETRKINLLFKSMQSKKMRMVIVADEYGQTAGLVALEDILEEIVGNIQDEYDEDDTYIEELADGSFLIEGRTPLEELEDRLGMEFDEEEDVDTLNGYLIAKLDKIPSEDEHSIIDDRGYRFEIQSVANKTIDKVRASRIPIDDIDEETPEIENTK